MIKKILVSNFSKFVKLTDSHAASLVANKMADNLGGLPDNALNIAEKITHNSDVGLDHVRSAIMSVDSLSPKPMLQRASNVVSNSPKVTAIGKGVVSRSPEIAEIIVGFTPLAPYSRLIGDIVGRATKQSQSNTEMSEHESKFCSECGFKLKQISKFCRKCGMRQELE